MSGMFDDLPAERFGIIDISAPMPEGVVVIWNQGDERFYGTVRGTDKHTASTWNRWDARRWAIELWGNDGKH